MRLRPRLLLLSASVLAIFRCAPAAVEEPVVADAVTDQYRPLAFDQQRLSGLLANRMRANVEGYLETMPAGSLNPQRIGYYLDAAANAFDYTHDQNLGAAMKKALQFALALQPKDTAVSGRLLLGLLSYYRVMGDQAVLAKCRSLGDRLLSGSVEPSALEPLVFLYAYTGERRYLDASRKIARTLYPSNSTAVTADPDMTQKLPELLGLAALYRVTADSSYLKAVSTAWRQIRFNHLTVTGTLAENSGDPQSACAMFDWIRLTFELFRLTGQAQYGDELEQTAYNQLLASQDGRTGNIFTKVPLNGAKAIDPTGDCRDSVAAGISIIPALAWGHYGRGLAINFYSAGSAVITLRERRDVRLSHRTVPHLYRGNVRLYEEANFPESGEILLHIEPDYTFRFPVRLRVPSWTSHFDASINGSHTTGKPGDYVVLNRRWKRGDTVRISMGMPLRYVATGASGEPAIAIQRGPQILSVSKMLNPQIADLAAVRLPAPAASQLTIENNVAPLPNGWSGDQAYRIGGPEQSLLVFVPFADAAVYRTTFPVPAAR